MMMVRFSLICAAILYLMWKNVGVGESWNRHGNSPASSVVRRSRHHYSVDCAKAHKGLFLGIFVLVLTIISLVLFFALTNENEYKGAAIMEVNVARLALFCMTFIAVLIGMFQVRNSSKSTLIFIFFIRLLISKIQKFTK